MGFCLSDKLYHQIHWVIKIDIHILATNRVTVTSSGRRSIDRPTFCVLITLQNTHKFHTFANQLSWPTWFPHMDYKSHSWLAIFIPFLARGVFIHCGCECQLPLWYWILPRGGGKDNELNISPELQVCQSAAAAAPRLFLFLLSLFWGPLTYIHSSWCRWRCRHLIFEMKWRHLDEFICQSRMHPMFFLDSNKLHIYTVLLHRIGLGRLVLWGKVLGQIFSHWQRGGNGLRLFVGVSFAWLNCW